MDMKSLINSFKAKGIDLWIEEGKLKWGSRQEDGVMTDDLLAELKEYKPEIIKYLSVDIKEDEPQTTEKGGTDAIDDVMRAVRGFFSNYNGPRGHVRSVVVPARVGVTKSDVVIDLVQEEKNPNRYQLSEREPAGSLEGNSDDIGKPPIQLPLLLLPGAKIIKRGERDYTRAYRPRRILEVYGQDNIKKVIATGLDTGRLPHVLLFHGLSGTGKTTMARIIGMGLNCVKGPTSEPCCDCENCKGVLRGCSFGFKEFDAGWASGVDAMRKEVSDFDHIPIGHDYRINLFDECHRYSSEAQHVFLKPTEDVYPNTYFIFCTTDPSKMIDTLRNRCMSFEFRPVEDEEIRRLLIDVCEHEGLKYSPDALIPIIKDAKGMPRNALTLLQREVLGGGLAALTETSNIVISDKPEDTKLPAKLKKPFGTMEWADKNINCCKGCSHNCRYCYGRGYAIWYKRLAIEDSDKWQQEIIMEKAVNKGYRKRKEVTMFPSTHDITPTNFKACHTVLGKLLKAGNEVVVVSKPHRDCIDQICRDFSDYKALILFRFTITANDDALMSYWEPGAPSFKERLECLEIAYRSGFKTSVSTEPMLDPDHIDELIAAVEPLVNDTIWIGLMQHFEFIKIDNAADEAAVNRIKEGQTVDKIRPIYEKQKDNPKIQWKESIRNLLGLDDSVNNKPEVKE
jgi:DNA polymerase III delta prime subunit